MNSKHDVKVQVHLQQFGPPGTIYLIGEAKDLASIQAIQGKIMADEGYWTLVHKSVEVMEPPTIALLQQLSRAAAKGLIYGEILRPSPASTVKGPPGAA